MYCQLLQPFLIIRTEAKLTKLAPEYSPVPVLFSFYLSRGVAVLFQLFFAEQVSAKVVVYEKISGIF